jgi:hypothetical protein
MVPPEGMAVAGRLAIRPLHTMSDQPVSSEREFSRAFAVTHRKGALRQMSFAELSALPGVSKEELSCPDPVGHLGICHRELPDGSLLVMLRCQWPEPYPFVQYSGFVKMRDDSCSERRPELFDEQIRADIDERLRAAT